MFLLPYCKATNIWYFCQKYKLHVCLHVSFSILSSFEQILDFSTEFLKSRPIQYEISRISAQRETRLYLQTDKRTDMTKLMGVFCRLWESALKWRYEAVELRHTNKYLADISIKLRVYLVFFQQTVYTHNCVIFRHNTYTQLCINVCFLQTQHLTHNCLCMCVHTHSYVCIRVLLTHNTQYITELCMYCVYVCSFNTQHNTYTQLCTVVFC